MSTTETDASPSKKYVGAKYRMGPTVFFGPFDSLADLHSFCVAKFLSLDAIELVDPVSDVDGWW